MPTVPQLSTSRSRRRTKRDRPAAPELVTDKAQDTTEAGHSIQGHQASDIEWATYKALRSLGWDDSDLVFQAHAFGGRSQVGGGQVLDFLIERGPQPVVIDVRGQAWHGSAAGKSAADRWREIRLAAMPAPPKLVVVWEEIAHNRDRLRSLLLRELGAKR
jgi:hypothetical protein